MKTLEILHEKKIDVLFKLNHSSYDDSEKRKLESELSDLNFYILYMESNPTEEFLKKEEVRLSKLIKSINDRFVPPGNAHQIPTVMLTKMKRDFLKEYNLPKLRKQLSTIQYLLK